MNASSHWSLIQKPEPYIFSNTVIWSCKTIYCSKILEPPQALRNFSKNSRGKESNILNSDDSQVEVVNCERFEQKWEKKSVILYTKISRIEKVMQLSTVLL